MKTSSTLIALDVFINDHKKQVHNIDVLYEDDVAALFEIPIARIKTIVKKNVSRFPSDFLFRIINKETKIETFAFTMVGLFMFAGQISNDRANKISVQLIEFLVARKPNIGFDLIMGKDC